MPVKGINREEKNGQWKGDLVGFGALHEWVRKHKEVSLTCESCGIMRGNRSHDLANISQEYKRDISDWEWLCRRCHMTKDGRLENFVYLASISFRNLIKNCIECGKEKIENISPRCRNCAGRMRYRNKKGTHNPLFKKRKKK